MSKAENIASALQELRAIVRSELEAGLERFHSLLDYWPPCDEELESSARSMRDLLHEPLNERVGTSVEREYLDFCVTVYILLCDFGADSISDLETLVDLFYSINHIECSHLFPSSAEGLAVFEGTRSSMEYLLETLVHLIDPKNTVELDLSEL